MTHLRISCKYFCAGVMFNEEGRVGICAPILAYMRGWTRARVEEYARIRHWTVEEV